MNEVAMILGAFGGIGLLTSGGVYLISGMHERIRELENMLPSIKDKLQETARLTSGTPYRTSAAIAPPVAEEPKPIIKAVKPDPPRKREACTGHLSLGVPITGCHAFRSDDCLDGRCSAHCQLNCRCKRDG